MWKAIAQVTVPKNRFAPPNRSISLVFNGLGDIPEFAVVIDSFEQRVQRPETPAEADALYSGKKKMHTLKSQVTIDEATGRLVDVSVSVPVPTADLTLLQPSTLMTRLPHTVRGLGDLGYQGIDALGCGS